MPRLVVVGGGISGLAAAWAARRAAGDLEILVLERDADVGGKARTVVRDGWLIEGGPGGFLGGREEMEQLVSESGMAAERVPASAAAAHRFLFLSGKMREVAMQPLAFARSGILSFPGLLRLAAEPFIPRRRDGDDESVWSFAARRLGSEAADRLILPMTLGIFAGDARQLSVQAAFPRMTALEHQYGSLIKGMIAKRGTSSGALTSFREGMQSLPRTLAARGGFQVRRRAEVRAIARGVKDWTVTVSGESEPVRADAVVLTGEPWAMATLLRPFAAPTAVELDAIECPPVAVVALGFGAADAARIPNGFGVLIGRGEGFHALGNLWDSRIYPGRSPDGTVLVRAMFGGQVDPSTATRSEEELVALAREEAARLYGITAEPVLRHVVVWPRAIPQYELGHAKRALGIERGLTAHPGLFICGYGLRAIAFADAATNGVWCGRRAAQWCAEHGAP